MDYSFLLKNFQNFAAAVSRGHISEETLPECCSKCLSNSFLESKTMSHFSQYTLETLDFFQDLSMGNLGSQCL